MARTEFTHWVVISSMERFDRQARNESLIREVNEEIAALGESASEEWADPEQTFSFECECGKDGCHGSVPMTLAEYERVRGQRDRFVLLPGHQNDEIEQVVEQSERYVIVDKRDEFEPLVE